MDWTVMLIGIGMMLLGALLIATELVAVPLGWLGPLGAVLCALGYYVLVRGRFPIPKR